MLDHVVWLLPAAVLASLTASFARFALVGAALVASSIMLLVVLSFLSTFWGETEYHLEASVVLRDPTPALIASLVTIAASLTVLLHQYSTRKLGRSIVLAVAGVILALVIPDYWPWPFLKWEEPQMIGFDTSGVRLSLDSSKNWVFDAFALRGGRPPKKNVAVRVEIHGLPPDYAANLITIRPRLVFPDGTVVQGVNAIEAPVPGQVDRKEPAFIEPLRSALGVERLFYGDPDRYRSWPVLITVDDELYARYRDHAGDYAAEMEVRLQQHRRTMELPLEIGAGQISGSHRVTVLEVIRQSEGRTVLLRESNVRLLFDPKPTLTSYSRVYYAFVNRPRGEAFLAESFGLSSSGALALGGFVVGSESDRLEIHHVTLRPAAHPSQPDAPRLDEAWLADATLVRVDVCYAGRLTQQLQVRGFRMDPR